MRTREWLLENARTHVEIDLFLRAGGDLTECSLAFRRDNQCSLRSGYQGKNIGAADSDYRVAHSFQMQIPEVAIRALCRRMHKARSNRGKKTSVATVK